MNAPTIAGLRARNRILAVLALVLTMTIWGSAFAVTKAALSEVPPFTLAFLRFVVAIAVMMPFVLYRERKVGTVTRAPWRVIALMGLTGVALHYGFYHLGLSYTTTTNAALIQGTIPAVTVVASAWLLSERIGWLRASGVAGSIAGVAIIILAGTEGGPSKLSLLGDLFMVGTVVAWTAYTLLGKLARESQSGLFTTALSNSFGAAFLIPFAAYEVFTNGAAAYSTSAWVSLVYLGVVSSALAMFLWNYSLAHLTAGQAGAFVNLEPVVAVAVAILYLGEPVLLWQLVGGALVLIGVYLANR